MSILPQKPEGQACQSQSVDLEQSQNLRELVTAQIKRQRHFQTSAELIDLIITKYPGCPRFASMMVDRLMAGDEALAAALQQEVL